MEITYKKLKGMKIKVIGNELEPFNIGIVREGIFNSYIKAMKKKFPEIKTREK